MKELVLLACLAFGFVMVTSFAQAQEVEGIYCRFDAKKWDGSLLKFLKQGPECKVELTVEWQDVEYDQTINIDPDKISLSDIWNNLTDG